MSAMLRISTCIANSVFLGRDNLSAQARLCLAGNPFSLPFVGCVHPYSSLASFRGWKSFPGKFPAGKRKTPALTGVRRSKNSCREKFPKSSDLFLLGFLIGNPRNYIISVDVTRSTGGVLPPNGRVFFRFTAQDGVRDAIPCPTMLRRQPGTAWTIAIIGPCVGRAGTVGRLRLASLAFRMVLTGRDLGQCELAFWRQ